MGANKREHSCNRHTAWHVDAPWISRVEVGVGYDVQIVHASHDHLLGPQPVHTQCAYGVKATPQCVATRRVPLSTRQIATRAHVAARVATFDVPVQMRRAL